MKRILGVVVLALLAAACGDVQGPNQLAPSPVAPVASVASTITITAMAGTGDSFGTVFLTAHVKDAAGGGVGAAVVQYTTTAGTLQPAIVTADGSGQAQNLVRTTTAATVTATAGSATVAIAVVPLAAPPPIVPPTGPIDTPPVFVPPPSPPPPVFVPPPVPVPTPTPMPTPPAPALVLTLTCSTALHVGSCNITTHDETGALVQPSGLTSAVWNFGDGNTATTKPLAQNTYSQPGTYTVTVTATSPGRAGSASATVTIL